MSETGDYIGEGQSRTFTLEDSGITATLSQDHRVIRVSVHASDGSFWYLALAAPQGQELLPGVYEGATRWPIQSPREPGLSFDGDGRGCNRLTGRFQVLEAVYASSLYIERFHATFEQHCEGAPPALFGEVQIINPPPATPTATATPPPPTPTATATPPPPALTATVSFVSETGDYIGEGQSRTFTLEDSGITATLSQDHRVIQVSVHASGGSFWYLALAAPQGQELLPGVYEGATRWPFQSPAEPGLSFYGDGRGCNRLTGRFQVLEAVYASSEYIERFHATFEQHCEGAPPALFGEVQIINPPPATPTATATPPPPTPTATPSPTATPTVSPTPPSVGGIVEMQVSGSGSTADHAADTSGGSSVPNYAVLAGAIAAAGSAVTAGIRYARRRWLV